MEHCCQRIAELAMVMIIPMAILFIPVVGSHGWGSILYKWDNPGYGAEHGIGGGLDGKTPLVG